ncbi:hypothetical protein Bp8pC_150 [Bacillus phage Bp8p-C]|uniref:Uncharacterized protein n=2 Tax=Agatevirus Bp8pC TaxID=1910937 RepID=A0A0A0PLH9_9CAUD|nr:terminase small subunit [Bacillus phage Bp8p-C]YP_009784450.1 hypothetical protein QLX39_gp198 [Bacillus phage Bp8p-T]AHJ87580.1 hypothetical protein Bp8pC_150 [Bacillus phage Bp8p-C]AHJ87791.1 hypothetical protein Bp8pT_150 [Bacillus phage Bp8p-T]
MSMSENIKKRLAQKKDGTHESQVRDLLNVALLSGLEQFVHRLHSGEIPIDNMADLQRVLLMYKEVNGINDAMEGAGGQGALPEINMKQDKVIKDIAAEGTISIDEEGTLDVSDLSVEETAELIRQMDIAQNAENEGSF